MKRVIYDNYSLYEKFDETKQFIMEEYPEMCDVKVTDKDGNVTYEPNENKVWDYIYDDDQIEWDSVFADLKHYFDGKKVIMFGSCGRWNGVSTGWEVGTFEEMFRKITKDCDDIRITDEDGKFFIDCWHHDGSNSVQIKVLNDKGYQIYDDWCYSYGRHGNDSMPEMFHILNNNFYSALPHFYKKVYDC